jgi:nicotinamide-nucleotide amidase
MAEALDPAIPEDLQRLAEEVLQSACDRGLTLATAESCTGGLLASLLTDFPGLSHAFERGFVAYTHDAKAELLNVGRDLLETDGAVSESVARAMAEGAVAGSRADVAVAITGFTDSAPEGAEGLVHVASARRGGATRHSREQFGDLGRAEVRLAALRAALTLMREAMADRAHAA